MRERTESGATMVEGAIVVTLFFFLVFMVGQAAFFARAYLATRDAAAGGARAGAVEADNADADYGILRAVAKSTSSLSSAQIQSIVVFSPQGTNSSMPAGCASGPVIGMCNYYTAADLTRPITDFQTGSSFTGDGYWPASGRSTALSTGLAHLGVYIKVGVGGISSPLPTSVSNSSIVELEPHS